MLNFNVNLANGMGSVDGLLFFVYLMIAVVISVFTARIASDKGHNGVGWFFLGIVTGFVGLAIALAMPYSSYEDERDREFLRKLKEENERNAEKNGDDGKASFDG